MVALVGLAFCGLLGRAPLHVQIIGAEFFQKEGEKRYAHALEVPGHRGRILDRNGALLASSVPAPSVWAIPKDFSPPPTSSAQAAEALRMDGKEFDARLATQRQQLRLDPPPGGCRWQAHQGAGHQGPVRDA